MPRIRTIKPEIWSDEKIMSISRDARCLFIGMFNFADDNGVLVNSPKEMKARIFPGDDDTDVPAWLEELIQIGLVLSYEVEGHKYVAVKSLKTHQIIDKPRKSNLPIAPITEIIRNQLKSTEILNGREGKGRERKEGKGKEGKVASPPPGGNGDARPAPFSCQGFEISQDYLDDLVRDFPQLPAAYLLQEFFPRMKAWCLDHRNDPRHNKKFDATGRLKNPRSCFLNWLKTEDPAKAAGYRPRKPETIGHDPPGFATVFDATCEACRGSGRYRDDPCGCGRLEPLIRPDPKCLDCGGTGLAKEGPCKCLKLEKYLDPAKKAISPSQ